MNKDINPQQETSTTKRKHSIKPNDIKWNLTLIEQVYEKWYRKYSSMPITKIIFENFLLNKRDSLNLDFNIKISNADLVRIGLMLGFDYNKMNKAFGQYRQRLGEKKALNCNYCPKSKESFMNGSQIVKDLQSILKENCVPYIYTDQTEEEKKSYLKSIGQDYQIKAQEINEQIRMLQLEAERYTNIAKNYQEMTL